jgi:hypothetical protein
MDDDAGDTELMAEVLKWMTASFIFGRGNGLPAPVTPGQHGDVDPMRWRSSVHPGAARHCTKFSTGSGLLCEQTGTL